MDKTLTKLSFVNFQSLADTELDLDPGLNVVVGPSNLGKSAALRALKALVRNAAAPGLVREGEKEFRIGAAFSDGTVETLTKGKNISQFEVCYPDGSGLSHAKAGASDVPDEVEQLWAIPDTGKRELVFASQHEPPFLLAEPASAVTQVVGDLTNASILTEAVAKANKQRTTALNDAKARQREADEARAEILTHAGLSARGKALQAAREAYEFAQEKVARWEALVQLSTAFNKAEQEREMNTAVLARATDVSEVTVKAQTAVDRLQELETLDATYRNVVSNLWQTNTGVELIQQKQASLENNVQQLLEQAGTCPVCGSTTC